MGPTGNIGLIIDPDRYLVYRNDAVIHLTRTEFRILALIAAARGRILTREQIAQAVWDIAPITFPRSIDVHISRIRKKVGSFDGRETITALKGVGYKIIENVSIVILDDSNASPDARRNGTME